VSVYPSVRLSVRILRPKVLNRVALNSVWEGDVTDARLVDVKGKGFERRRP
jgi:hypothetical protein